MLRVSIICPLYNGARFIAAAIQSVVDNAYPYLELIIVDDGSTDGGDGIAQRFADTHSQVRFLRHDGNRGRSVARNTGLAAANPESEYILFLDHDDLLKPNCVETMVGILEQHPDPVLLPDGQKPMIGSVMMEADNIDVNGYGCNPKYRSFVFTDGNVYGFGDWLDSIGCFPSSRLLWRRWVVEAVGSYDPALFGMEDWDFYLRAALTSVTLFRTGIMTSYRNHDGQSTDDVSENQKGYTRIYGTKVPLYKAAWAARGGRY